MCIVCMDGLGLVRVDKRNLPVRVGAIKVIDGVSR
jgi:hypothetical protein